jgi:ATP-dependent exoDNAse (exonuclease V) alpha subunit
VLDKSGRELIFSLKRNVDYSNKVEVFSDINLQLQQGLKIIFTKNNKEVGLINSETAVIEQIGKNKITLKFEDGKSKSIPTDQLKHIDYGYCVTVHASQGKTFDNTISAINNNKLLNNQKSWLVAISRHRNEFMALVEDKSTLKTYLIKNKGREISAIEFQSKSMQNQGAVLNDLPSEGSNGKINKVGKLQSSV